MTKLRNYEKKLQDYKKRQKVCYQRRFSKLVYGGASVIEW